MIAPVQKINIIAEKSKENEVLDILYSLGVAHIIEPASKKNTTKQTILKIQKKIDHYTLKRANVVFALNFLNTHLNLKKSFMESMGSVPKTFTHKVLKKKVRKTNIDDITLSISEVEKKWEEGKARQKQIEAEIAEINPWKNVTELSEDTAYTKSITGVLPLNAFDDFSSKLEQTVHDVHIETFHETPKVTYLKIIFLAEQEQSVKLLCEESLFKIVAPPTKELPCNRLAALEEDRLSVQKSIAQFKKYIKELKKNIEILQMSEDYYTWKIEKYTAQKKVVKTHFFTVIQAWLKKENVKILQSAFSEVSPQIIIVKVKTSSKDKPPVILENNNFIRPFEVVTGVYGLPQYREIDPTPYLSPFFIVFFALCLTDAGYGLVMAIGSIAAIKLMKIPPEKQRLWRLLAYGGLFTFFIGALFGGWFGIDVKSLSPGPIKSFIDFFQIINPIEDTLLFMIIAFCLGIIQIWFAQIVKIIASLKLKDRGTALSGAGWAVFLIAGLMWVMGKAIKMTILSQIGFILLLLVIVYMIAVESRNTKNIMVKPFVGLIVIIQGLIGFMSDTLSYSRLMALGLATGIIAFIINTIAGIFRDIIPYVGWIVWAAIIIGGHIFNLGINALGAFIHSGRLQYVEFFPKFLEGGGVKFNPFRRMSKHFIIK